MSKPLISVIMTAYNAEEIIEKSKGTPNSTRRDDNKEIKESK